MDKRQLLIWPLLLISMLQLAGCIGYKDIRVNDENTQLYSIDAEFNEAWKHKLAVRLAGGKASDTLELPTEESNIVLDQQKLSGPQNIALSASHTLLDLHIRKRPIAPHKPIDLLLGVGPSIHRMQLDLVAKEGNFSESHTDYGISVSAGMLLRFHQHVFGTLKVSPHNFQDSLLLEHEISLNFRITDELVGYIGYFDWDYELDLSGRSDITIDTRGTVMGLSLKL